MSQVMRKAIVTGTGVGDELKAKNYEMSTPFGTVLCQFAVYDETEVVFLSRHGLHHSVPPHKINYRANMYALHKLGVNDIYSICAVGSMNPDYGPGSIVELTDYIDFTMHRDNTYYDGEFFDRVTHLDTTEPFCHTLRRLFRENWKGKEIQSNGVYVCTEGPRFETAAEIRMFRRMGGDVVGMTTATEAALAKELGMCYQPYAVVSNWATGIDGMHSKTEILMTMRENRQALIKTFVQVFQSKEEEHCDCTRMVEL
ncbi:MAG: MTAP family purine nucleoside phosphorylase [Bacillota bacterium]|nr:MTAP family purine nucleoside phosphorylase [Bacillota bacterium]